MIAADPRIKNGVRTIATATTKAARSTISAPRIATTSAPITRKTFGGGTSTPTAVTSSALANVSHWSAIEISA